MLEFTIPCNPPKATAQSTSRIFYNKKTGKPFFGKNDKGRATRNELLTLLEPYRPSTPIRTAVCLTVHWDYPHLKNTPKKYLDKIIPCSKRPDADNILKMLCDCLTRLGFWLDDAQIVKLNFEKNYSPNPHIYIKIEKI